MIERLAMLALMLCNSPREKGERGATATEYALLVGLVALAIATAVGVFSGALTTFFNDLGTTVTGWASSDS